jgi:hypothetical protein
MSTTRDRWIEFMTARGFTGNALSFDAVKSAVQFAESEVHRALQLGESSLELAYACTSESGVTRVYDIRASCEYVTTADQARRRGLALIAAANEADQLASDSEPATGAEFLAASAKAIEPRSDEEIAEIISDMEKR